MQSFRVLIGKEFSEHGWIFLSILPICLLGFILTLAGGQLNEAGSPFEAVRLFCVSLFILVELVICNRLVVHEFTGKTQLFLEGLPISRIGLLSAKFLFGFSIALISLSICFALAALVAMRHEGLDAGFLSIMLLRLFTFAFFSYAFFFMMGLLGRYRIPLYLAMFMAFVFLSNSTEFDPTAHGPLALVNSQFAFERTVVPWTSVAICLAAGLAFMTISFAMFGLREGSIASLLAEKMSHREKLLVAIVLLATMFSASALDKIKTPDPYVIPDAATVAGARVRVHVEPTEDDRIAKDMAQRVYSDLEKVCEYLAIKNVPELFIINRRDLDADQYELADLDNARGVLIRANFVASGWEYQHFLSWLLDAWLSDATGYNAARESNAWVLEGFAQYWIRREEFGSDASRQSKLDLRAAYAGSLGVEVADSDSWYRYRERVGPPIASAVACRGLVLAEQRHGAEKLQSFLQEALRCDLPRDSRVLWYQWRNPLAMQWKNEFGQGLDEFRSDWIEHLEQLSLRWDDIVESIPRVRANGVANPLSESSYEFIVVPEIEPTPDHSEVMIRFETIDPIDRWSNFQETELQVEPYAAGTSIVLKDRFTTGDRLMWTAAVHAHSLGCEVISGWKRLEVR